MWEDCLWNYVFPTLERASHMVNKRLQEKKMHHDLVAFLDSSSGCRLQPHQKMNGKGKSLEREVEKQFTCSSIIGNMNFPEQSFLLPLLFF